MKSKMHKYELYVKRFNWGFIEIDGTGQMLTLKIIPKEVPLHRELVKSIQKKLINFLENEGFQAVRVKKQ
tara:strand:- start:1 stop:210 length:210 start_codon:yes stop_codon:yes gene_type:complete